MDIYPINVRTVRAWSAVRLFGAGKADSVRLVKYAQRVDSFSISLAWFKTEQSDFPKQLETQISL